MVTGKTVDQWVTMDWKQFGRNGMFYTNVQDVVYLLSTYLHRNQTMVTRTSNTCREGSFVIATVRGMVNIQICKYYVDI